MTGPIWVAASVGYPTVSEDTASSSWLRKRFDPATEPTMTTRDAAEHFWPACPNADATTSFTARSRSDDGVTITAFLPEVSASSGRSGRNERKSSAVS